MERTERNVDEFLAGLEGERGEAIRRLDRMITERMFPSLHVLSHVEIARGIEIKSLGTIS